MERRLIAGFRPPRRGLLKASLFLGSSLMVVGLFLFTHGTIDRLTSEVQTTSRVLARFCAQASIPATNNPELQKIFSETISSLDFPIVITDTTGTPRAWRAVGVDPELVPAASIDSLAERRTIAPPIRARLARVKRRVAELDRGNPPIEMIQPETGVRLGVLHYGEPEVLAHLRWMPFVSVAAVALLVLLGL